MRFTPSAAVAEKLRDGNEDREERIGEAVVEGVMDGRAEGCWRPDTGPSDAIFREGRRDGSEKARAEVWGPDTALLFVWLVVYRASGRLSWYQRLYLSVCGRAFSETYFGIWSNLAREQRRHNIVY